MKIEAEVDVILSCAKCGEELKIEHTQYMYSLGRTEIEVKPHVCVQAKK